VVSMSKWRLRRRKKHGCLHCARRIAVEANEGCEWVDRCGIWQPTCIGTHRSAWGVRPMLRAADEPCNFYLDIEDAECQRMETLIDRALAFDFTIAEGVLQ